MQAIHHPLNEVEATLVIDRLADEGIHAQLVGSFLSSAAGELPAHGLLRILVRDEDAIRAKRIVAAWTREMSEAAATTDDDDAGTAPSVAVPKHSLAGSGIGMLLAGMLLGAAAAWLALRVPDENEMDYDANGVVDERYIYAGDLLDRVESDRNGDGRVDWRMSYSARGSNVIERDDDFDGRGERRDVDRHAFPSRSEYDHDGDGFTEVVDDYLHGVLAERVYRAPPDGTVIKRESYEHGRLVRSEVDLDRDGSLETRREHDAIGEALAAD